jgi:hypothetical protein
MGRIDFSIAIIKICVYGLEDGRDEKSVVK